MRRRSPLVLFAMSAQLLSPAPAATQTPEGSAMQVASALVEAFNRHDASAMAALVSDDFELFYMSGDGLAELSTRGADGLRSEMMAYFEAQPEVRSEIAGSIPGDRFVAFREQIVGGDSSLAVYEIVGGLVRRAWYYPAEPSGR